MPISKLSCLRLLFLGLGAWVALAVPAAAQRSGLTWGKGSHNATYSVDTVGCGSCDPYVGDTLCNQSLPILCIRQDASPNPGVATSFYNGWAAGHIHLTPPQVGTSLGSLANADAICTSYFGPGYRMAEFHDGSGGWAWQAYGNVNAAFRFWLYINDQPANCWN
ncbi:MAG TPA: flagellar hook-length control protein [Thermoanaerobaculia bacterium]|nr:flagellar hook-length control protein [Thermoanaerobaculia bacterium]